MKQKDLAKWINKLIEQGCLWRFYKSKEWIKLRNQILKENHYECAICKAKGIITRYDIDKHGNKRLLSTVHHNQYVRSHFELIFFGPCSNPYVIIGDNDYRLKNCQLADGEYIVINSKNRTIQKHLTSGENENVFYLRNDNEIFRKLPAGKSIVTKSADTEIQITNYIERGEPIWI